MRLFGGSQVDTLLTRFKFDENMPIEANMIARLVEQAQTAWKAPTSTFANTCWNMTTS